MTTERKIGIIENVKSLLEKHYKEHGICILFFICLTKEESMEATKTSAIYFLGKILTKHRPKDIKDNGLCWWGKDKEGLQIRLSVCDKMISELKQQKQ